jgi:hypothetical protein
MHRAEGVVESYSFKRADPMRESRKCMSIKSVGDGQATETELGGLNRAGRGCGQGAGVCTLFPH